MFQIKWLRKFVRKNTKPIPVERAANWRQRFAILYAILAWNAFGGVCYMMYTGRRDWAKAAGYKTDEDDAMPPAVKWAKALGIEEAKVIRVSGVKLEHQYEIRKDKEAGDKEELAE